MKTKLISTFLSQTAALVLLSTLIHPPSTAFAQGTAFTYQGRLNDGSNPASGSYDVAFTLFATNVTGSAVAGPVTNSAITVSNGLFTVTLDFGAAAFPGADRWLEISVRPGTSTGAYTALTPRQPITATPYAVSAANLTGTLPLAQLPVGTVTNGASGVTLSGVFTGNATGLTNLNAAQLASGTVPAAALGNAWNIAGNSGTTPGTQFLGTTDNQPLELWVNNQRALRIEPNFGGPNLVGGHVLNSVAPNHAGSVIAGGGSPNYSNRIDADYSVIGGGSDNAIQGSANQSVIAGGDSHRIAAGAYGSVIGGGESNLISTNSNDGTVGGGFINSIQPGSTHGTIGGGFLNRIETNANFATIPGGNQNFASGNYAFAGGDHSKATGISSVALGGYTTASGLAATALGSSTTASGAASTALGSSTVAGGFSSIASGDSSTANGNFATALGRRAKANRDGAFVWADAQDADFSATANNQFLLRATGGVGIGTANPQGSLHVYSANNPTVVRVQSAGTPGFGRVEFVSNPQGDANEWRPGYIQSADNGGFTGGLSFVVNGSGVGNKFAEVEAMRLVNGRVGIGTATPSQALHVIGNILATGTITGSSDRNVKENFASVDPREVLVKVAALPITRWNYKADTAETHLGPMAQDFYAAFNVGMDDKHISMVDADGVALAAIQGLNEKLTEELNRRDVEHAELQQRLDKLERLLEDKSK